MLLQLWGMAQVDQQNTGTSIVLLVVICLGL